jgi:N-acetyl-anhydromuramyl-L-alanine amidase AmpD
MRLGIFGAFLTAMVLAGCAQPTYTVLTDLPVPPRELGPEEPAEQACQAQTDSRPAEPVAAETQASRPSGAPQIALPEGWVPAVKEQRWRHIVVHHSATDRGGAESFDRMHRTVRGWDELGYHFVITNGNGGTDGNVEVGSRWVKQKWGAHCGGTPNNEYNDYGIGICLVGNFEDRSPSAKQLVSLDALVGFLARQYQIPPDNIIGHCQAPNAQTACPGKVLLAHVVGELRQEVTK